MSQTVQLNECREADPTEVITEHVTISHKMPLCQTSTSLEMMWRWKATAVQEIHQQMHMLR